MAHKLHLNNGEASMMYVGGTPWHGLGKKLDAPATAKEAIKAAKMDWTVIKQPLYAGEQKKRLLKDRFAIVRSDQMNKRACAFLGLVGPGYKPLQNTEAFDFFDSIVGEGAAIYHTAGVLGEGERVWILAKLPAQMRIVGDDVVDK